MILLVIDIPSINLAQRLYFEGRPKKRLAGPILGRSDRTYSGLYRLASVEIVVITNARRMSVFTGKIHVE